MNCYSKKGSKESIAFVFSCPGKNEEEAGYPAAKATGTNLNSLLLKLSTKLNRNDLSRTEITIANAWGKVEYEESTGRSEATDSEIIGKDNILRLNEELKNISDFIICCGDKAELAVSKCTLKTTKIIVIKHLGNKALNSIKHDENGNKILAANEMINNGDKRTSKEIGESNTSKRLDIICKKIVDNLT